jgi:hypothetical protein
VTVATLAAPGAASGRACEPETTPLLVTDHRLFRYDGSLVADVVVANVTHNALQHVHVSVEFYDFFGGLLRAERTVLTPLVLQPAYRASFRVATPFTQGARTVAYRFTGVRDSRAFQSLVVCDAAL